MHQGRLDQTWNPNCGEAGDWRDDAPCHLRLRWQTKDWMVTILDNRQVQRTRAVGHGAIDHEKRSCGFLKKQRIKSKQRMLKDGHPSSPKRPLRRKVWGECGSGKDLLRRGYGSQQHFATGDVTGKIPSYLELPFSLFFPL